MRITGKGMVFSFDALFSAILFSIILLAGFWQASFFAERESIHLKDSEFMLYSFFLGDSLVKNSDQNVLLGIAFFDSQKKRVKGNQIVFEKIHLRQTF